jgi:DNA-binding MarR family transcriptional regulator
MATDNHRKGIETARRVVNECLAGRIRLLSRLVTGRYDAELKEHGLTANQVTILAVVAMLEKTTPTDMQPYLMMDASTISRNVARMIENHWLGTIPAEDRRSHFLIVAPGGFEVLANAAPAWERAHAWAEELFGERGTAAIRELSHAVNPLVPL